MRGAFSLYLRLGSLVALGLAAVFWAVILWEGVPGLPSLLTGWDWAPPLLLGGVAPFLGTLVAVTTGLALGAGGGYLAASGLVFPGGRCQKGLGFLFALGSWVPTVALGLVFLRYVLPALRTLGLGSGYGLLAASFILAASALPQAVRRYAQALSSMADELLLAALALGATAEVSRRILAPAAAQKAIRAHTLGLGSRLLGESAAVALVVGNNGLSPPSLGAPSATLSSVLLTEGGGATPASPWGHALWGMGLLLLLLSVALGAGARRWR